MPTPTAFTAPSQNRLLAALPRVEYERLIPHLEQVHLPQGKVLFEAGDLVRHAYFLIGGMASLLSATEDGDTVEIAMAGNEGMVGVPIILRVGITPYRSMIQITADAMKIKADALKTEFNRHGQLQDLLLKYTHALLAQVSQSAVCNRFHTVDARLGRWLLMTRDRVRSENFQLTQELISHMLGTPRTVVTVAANKMQDAGLIRYKRGKITILNPHGLEAASCECYGIVVKEISHFLAA
jgi:CRP-like cAMP-binding protein